jgi:hypothetical protein
MLTVKDTCPKLSARLYVTIGFETFLEDSYRYGDSMISPPDSD